MKPTEEFLQLPASNPEWAEGLLNVPRRLACEKANA